MSESMVVSLDLANPVADQVLVEAQTSVRILVLNRPRQLNALSSYMVSQLLKLFLTYEEDPSVKLIILKGKGRAFCAGGDVSSLARNIFRDPHGVGADWRKGLNFVKNQCHLDYVIATNKKPQVSFLNGIVMGGGAGVSIHGRFRVVTENTVFAMPEAVMGTFPDVGASYFLSRLPGFFGEYVGLTGARLDGAEMLACGLATHFVPSAKLPLLEEELCRTVLSGSVNISRIIGRFAEQPVVKEKSPFHQLHIIDKCFSCTTVEEILSSLEIEAGKKNDKWISTAIQSLKKASPISLKISLRSIREGRFQEIGQCFVREYRMVCNVMRAELSRDVYEGIRAILVDKDGNPKWEPSRLDLVSEKMVEHYFSRLDDKGWQDLKLPLRSKLPQLAMARL